MPGRAVRRAGRRQHVEAQLGGAAETVANPAAGPARRATARDAVGADALDRRLGDADLVDAPADDLEALLDRRLRAFGHAGFGRHNGDHRVGDPGHRDVRSADPKRPDGGGKLAQQRHRLLALAGFPERDRDHVGVAADRLRLDARLPKHADRIGVEGLHALALERSGVDLEHEIGSAPQVEAERDLLFREPARQGGELLRRQKVRKRRNETDQDHERVDNEKRGASAHWFCPLVGLIAQADLVVQPARGRAAQRKWESAERRSARRWREAPSRQTGSA